MTHLKMTQHLPNAFENIVSACERKIDQLYPDGAPQEVIKCCKEELTLLKYSRYLDDYEICRVLSSAAAEKSEYLEATGVLANSYVIYLLTEYSRDLNATHDRDIFPNTADPQAIYRFLQTGVTLDFDYNISEAFLPDMKRTLQALYPDHVLAPIGRYKKFHSRAGIEIDGFLILPNGKTMDDYPEMNSYLSSGEPCLCGGYDQLRHIPLHTITFTLHTRVNIPPQFLRPGMKPISFAAEPEIIIL